MDISLCSRLVGNQILLYDVKDIIAAAEGLPICIRPLADFNLEEMHFFASYDDANIKSFIAHMRRLESVDVTVPIILAADGCLLDGMHRLARAELNGETNVTVVQLLTDPKPLRTIDISE